MDLHYCVTEEPSNNLDIVRWFFSLFYDKIRLGSDGDNPILNLGDK